MPGRKEVFTFQVVEETLRARFPGQADELTRTFVSLPGFDALVGNNDRHQYDRG